MPWPLAHPTSSGLDTGENAGYQSIAKGRISQHHDGIDTQSHELAMVFGCLYSDPID